MLELMKYSAVLVRQDSQYTIRLIRVLVRPTSPTFGTQCESKETPRLICHLKTEETMEVATKATRVTRQMETEAEKEGEGKKSK